MRLWAVAFANFWDAPTGTPPRLRNITSIAGLSSQFEYRWKNRFWEIRLEPLRTPSGEISGCLGSAMDITNRKKSEEQTHYQARHDALTDWPTTANSWTGWSKKSGAPSAASPFTVLLLDLDGLKRINDFHGHLAGNRALQRLAAVMNEHCRSTDLAVRYGGDEFAVVLIDSDKSMAEQVAHASRTACTPVKVSRLSASVLASDLPG